MGLRVCGTPPKKPKPKVVVEELKEVDEFADCETEADKLLGPKAISEVGTGLMMLGILTTVV